MAAQAGSWVVTRYWNLIFATRGHALNSSFRRNDGVELIRTDVSAFGVTKIIEPMAEPSGEYHKYLFLFNFLWRLIPAANSLLSPLSSTSLSQRVRELSILPASRIAHRYLDHRVVAASLA